MPLHNVNTPLPVSVLKIVCAVANMYNVTLAQMRTPCRVKHLAFARQVAMFLLREKFGWSFAEIGGIFGRDHSTVLYAIQKVRECIQSDESFRTQLEYIRKECETKELVPTSTVS
jgi:chromosomal replication initiator protein